MWRSGLACIYHSSGSEAQRMLGGAGSLEGLAKRSNQNNRASGVTVNRQAGYWRMIWHGSLSSPFPAL